MTIARLIQELHHLPPEWTIVVCKHCSIYAVYSEPESGEVELSLGSSTPEDSCHPPARNAE